MSKTLLLLFLVCSMFTKAQTTCSSAIALCNNFTFTVGTTGGVGISSTLSVSNPTNDPFPPNVGCLKAGAANPTWMILTIAVTGSLGFSISNNVNPNSQMAFHDWILWPYSTNNTCSKIFNDSLAPVRCNWNTASYGGTGMGNVPTGANPGNYEPALSVNAGDQFLLLLDNYSGINTTLTFSSTGTASLNCGNAFNPDVYACQNTQITYTVNSIGWSNTSFTLNPGNLVQSSPVFTLNPLAAQIYTVSVVGTNTLSSVQQSVMSTFALNVQPVATLIAVSPKTICSGEEVSLYVLPTDYVSVFVQGPNAFSNSFLPQPNGRMVLKPTSSGTYSIVISYTSGCVKTSTVSLLADACTDIFKNKIENLKVWPNPANDYLYYNSDNNISLVEILDCSGRIFKQIPENTKVNLKNFMEGIYILNFYNGSSCIANTRVVIIR